MVSAVADDDIAARDANVVEAPQYGMGRELFGAFRDRAGAAESGASLFDAVSMDAAHPLV